MVYIIAKNKKHALTQVKKLNKTKKYGYKFDTRTLRYKGKASRSPGMKMYSVRAGLKPGFEKYAQRSK